jgi:ABC-type multidrug transport system ATPase subunit
VILAYEPTQGVDVGSRFDIYEALRTRSDAGAALLVKSSDPIELAGLCDRVLVMSRGTIVEEIPGDELDEVRIVEAIVRGPGMSKAARSPLGAAMPKAPSPVSAGDSQTVIEPVTTTRVDSARQASARSCATPGTRTSGARSSSSGCGCRWPSRSS